MKKYSNNLNRYSRIITQNRENGAAVVGLELKTSEDLAPLIQRMKERSFFGDYLNNKPDLFQFLV